MKGYRWDLLPDKKPLKIDATEAQTIIDKIAENQWLQDGKRTCGNCFFFKLRHIRRDDGKCLLLKNGIENTDCNLAKSRLVYAFEVRTCYRTKEGAADGL